MANPLGQLGELTNYSQTFGIMWFILQLIAVMGILYFLAWKFILKPSGYKDIIEVWDITGGRIIVRKDRGRWVEDKAKQTGEYRLLRDKEAKLKQPPIEWAMPNKKGRYKYTFLKTADAGHFDYQVLEPKYDRKEIPKSMPLADEDWAKHSIKKAIEKKTLSGFWNENKGSIIFITMAVLTLILVYWTIGFAQETATTIANSASAQANKLGEIAESLQNVANQLGGSTPNPGGEAPPPGV